MQRVVGWLQQAIDTIDRWGLRVAMVSLVVIMVLSSADALGRYAFKSPVLFAFDSVQWLMVFLFSGALMFSLRTGVHVRMGAVYGNLPVKWRRILDHFGYVLIIALSTTIARMLLILAYDHTVRNPYKFSIGLPLPAAIIEYALALGFAFLAIRALYMLARRISPEEGRIEEF